MIDPFFQQGGTLPCDNRGESLTWEFRRDAFDASCNTGVGYTTELHQPPIIKTKTKRAPRWLGGRQRRDALNVDEATRRNSSQAGKTVAPYPLASEVSHCQVCKFHSSWPVTIGRIVTDVIGSPLAVIQQNQILFSPIIPYCAASPPAVHRPGSLKFRPEIHVSTHSQRAT